MNSFFKGFLSTIIFFGIIYWFKKIDTKKSLITRIVLSSIAAFWWLLTAFVLLFDSSMAKNGDNIWGLFPLILAILHIIRLLLDVQSLLNLKNK